MFKRPAVLMLSVLTVFLLTYASYAAGLFGQQNYSADMETSTPQGKFMSKIFFKDGKQRMEMEKGKSLTIMRPDKRVMWVLMSDNKMYMEMSLDVQKKAVEEMLHDPNIKTEKEFIGNETVDGHPSKKYHLTIITGSKKEKSGFIWEASDLGNFPVKYQSEDKKHTTVWMNIKTGGVSDSLFELPSGYKKMDMPAMPGMGGGAPKRPRK